MSPLPSPLAVVCHDAGAANLVAAWLPAIAAHNTRLCMHGPAAMLLQRGLPGQGVGDLRAALDGAACVLTGTGWASDLEHDARVLAQRTSIQSIAVVDHWVNYRERFERHGRQALPDTIWVADEQALALARQCFPGVQLVQQPNTYLAQLVARVAPLPPEGDLLVLLEPMRDNWGRGTPGEFQALDYLVEYMDRLDLPSGTRLRLRPHPSEAPGKYDDWLRLHGKLASLDQAASLEQALSPARWTAGCQTAALVAAMAAGRTAICTLPPWAPPCRLPQPGLLHLRQLAEAMR